MPDIPLRVEIGLPSEAELRGPSGGGLFIMRGVVVCIAASANKVEVSFDNVPATVQLNSNVWIATGQVQKSGNLVVRAKAFGINSGGIAVESVFQYLTVGVLPSLWQPITVEVNDPPVPAAGATLEVGPAGKMLAVQMTTPRSLKAVQVLTSIDNYASTVPLLVRGELAPWSGEIMLPGIGVPYDRILVVREFDFFDQFVETEYHFKMVDVTPPAITIIEPGEDQKLVVLPAVSFPVTLPVRGNVSDIQSRYKDGTLQYSFMGQGNIAVTPENNGLFYFEVQVSSYGPHTLSMTAEDNSGNKTAPVVRRFEVVSNYKPKTIEELLAPRSYLEALQSFIRSHFLDENGNELDTEILRTNLHLDFGKISEPGSQVGSRTVNGLLLPVALLRNTMPLANTALSFRFTFDKPEGQPPLEFPDEGPHRLGTGILIGGARFSDPKSHTGAVEFDGTGYARFAHRPGLKVGDHDQDFSVSFWIHVNDAGVSNGPWRGILYKGHEDAAFTDVNRTFGIWLFPDSNTVHYRISTTTDQNAGGNSTTTIEVARWTHVAYVRRGVHLQLFLNGLLDSQVTFSGTVQPNTDELVIGKSPYHAGIDGSLDDLRIYNLALTPDDITALARSRNVPAMPEKPLAAYLRTAYEALLLASGTSYEESRSLPPKHSALRLNLAEKLGLLAPGGMDDYLDVLLPNALPPVQMEEWLSSIFDFPSTMDLLPAPQPLRGWLLQTRQDSLTRTWLQEDSTSAAVDRRPYLEPDLVDLEDINPGHHTAANILQSRTAELVVEWELLRASPTVDIALLQVFTNSEISSLGTIESADSAGWPVEAYLKDLSFTFAAFRRIRKYQALNVPLSEREKDDLAHLLIEVWKLRNRYPAWLREETALTDPLWPSSNTGGAFVSTHYKNTFLPWRGSVMERAVIEQRIATRFGDWQNLLDNSEQAVLYAQQIALPVLRDRLLGITDLPSSSDFLDILAERLLTDIAASGLTTLTLIDHASLTLQTLVNGIRTNRFEAGHPSAGWNIKTKWGSENDTDLAHFDEEWTWLGSYGIWRSAMMIYLYPQNALYPELRPKTPSAPNSMSEEYSNFLNELRNLALTSEAVAAISAKYSSLSGDELTYFLPVSIGLALEKAGLFTLSLDWYRKVYNPRQREGDRALAAKLKSEQNSAPAPQFDDRWSLDLNPHTIADRTTRHNRLWGNPYTRFSIGRIVACLVALADGEFARGTLDSREKALSLYLEAKQILGFTDLDDLPPTDPWQAYLPNPAFEALQMRVATSLRKIRLGLSYNGTPLLADPTREPGGAPVSTLVRPASYPFKVLLERSRQLLAQAQNLEAQYLAALVQRDAEEEKFRREAANAQLADETVSLRSLQETEANDGVRLASLQTVRTQLQRDRYQQWISSGSNQNEKTQIELMWKLNYQRYKIAVIDANSATNSAAMSVGLVFWNWGGAAAATALNFARAGEQISANDLDTQAQVRAIIASQERRQDEWQLQVDLGNKDLQIGNQQISLALDRVAIAERESRIARIQRNQAIDMLRFLSTKFTGREFYDWLQGVLAEIYASLLRMATTTAQQAERQLSFQRQQSLPGIIKQNYWAAASGWDTTNSIQNLPDRRGITGSARLLQDISTLDQYAFDSEKRLLNLSQTFSLSRQFPIEFQELGQTGLLNFATTLSMFDEGFPGHFMRLIKKVRVTVIALIPPTQGIRATLSTGGLSRVVTGDPNFPIVVIRQNPQAVALSSAVASTGVFELDVQSDLVYPFDGMGVDASWTLELPPAGNPFDFNTLFDVLITFEYTALNNSNLRERAVKQLPARMVSDRSWSVRQDLPDVWYDLANQASNQLEVLLPLSKADFPSYPGSISIEEVLITVRMVNGNTGDFTVSPSFTRPSGEVVSGLAVPAVHGVASSRQSGAATWRSTVLSETNRTNASVSTWRFELIDPIDGSFSLGQELRNSQVEDILIIMTFSGNKPGWPVLSGMGR